MLTLPILNVHLQTCPASWQQMTPTPQGRHCAHCNRTVVDFTHATAADLEAARAAAPGGHLCGRFRRSQLADSRPQLRPKLRRFLVALVLVCGLGLTSREALAQVRAVGSKPAPAKMQSTDLSKRSKPVPGSEQDYELHTSTSRQASAKAEYAGKAFTGYIDKMPEYKDGGIEGLLRFIAQNAHYPEGQQKSGKVFIDFVITKEGGIRDLSVVKGMGEPFDAEALRVVGLMGKWIPIKYDVRYTLPITFSNDSQPATQTKKKK